MIEKIRTLMLLIAASLLGYGGYIFLSSFEVTTKNIDVKLDEDGLDVKIENFKVNHENSGRKDWELKAELAQINQKTETTKMSNVEYIFIDSKMREFKVHADFGTLMNKTNDLDLEGNVKMIIETEIIKDQLANEPSSKQNIRVVN
ncbi:MAG: LPS export ABC transporter periplasmic protein LptC [Nitrospina sp.]|jgi:LPS export ABC transporter protein LptC|nr:LPS export ABC transporter periplasmic protein LptC [Nitrospina sp.]MBT6602193.1 LPS export ABC transporter periplasmic protein LptC [Nitrospina sp.]